jgi:uncharacterized protein (DUF885 family)
MEKGRFLGVPGLKLTLQREKNEHHMKYLTLSVLVFFGLETGSSQPRTDAPASLLSLIESYQKYQEAEFNAPDRPFPNVSTEAEKRRGAFYQGLLSKLLELNAETLPIEDNISWNLLKYLLEDHLASLEFEANLVPLNAEGGWYTDFIVAIDYQVFKSEKDVENYLSKLLGFKAYADQNIALMREGLYKGRTAPDAILKGRENIVDACITERPEDSPFYKPFRELPAEFFPEKQDAWRKDAMEAIAQSVTPAYQAFRDFWQKEYLPGAVKAPGIAAQPRGRAYYENRIRYFTTLPMTADEIFETGQQEVARIRSQMEAILKEVGFTGSFADFLHFLRTDPQFYAQTPEQLLKEAAWICKKMDGKLPQYFGKLPRNSYGVAPVPAAIAPTYTGGRYSEGSSKSHRAGFYWVNTYNLPARPLYVLPALTLHEAVPGHHLQISLAQELENVPEFRQNTYLSAFGEGWALYSEWLGEEMGMYETPYQRFGKLTYEMWRACRLVVDPGLHVKGWTREQAIEFMAGNTALSLHECTTEIDRYIGWPGQAVSYKIGELKIRELRKKAEEALGEKFDLRAFHDLVLSQGAVPLFVLEKMVTDWILSQAK